MHQPNTMTKTKTGIYPYEKEPCNKNYCATTGQIKFDCGGKNHE